MAVHENWVQNRQATAVCDFCNRRNIPLQKCQTCNINICKKCTAQGILQNDPRHMLAREAAESFDWHQWGKEKITGSCPPASIKRKNNISRVSTPEAEDSAESLPSQRSGGPGGYPAAVSNFQHPPIPYNYPMPIIFNQQYNHPIGLTPNLRQHPHIPQYHYSPSPYGMYGFSAGQPIYNHSVLQQPAYGSSSPQVPQVCSEMSNSAVSPVPIGHGRPLQNFRDRYSQPENNNDNSQAAGRRSVEEIPHDHQASQTTQAPPRSPVLSYGSLHAMHTKAERNSEKPSGLNKKIRHGGQLPRRHQGTGRLSDSPKEPSVAPKKPQTSCQALDASEKPNRGSKRSLEVAEGRGQDSSNDPSSLDRRPIKRPRQEIIPRSTKSEQHSRPTSISRASKRQSMAPEGHGKRDSGIPVAKKLRRGQTPDSRVVKVHIKSSAGVHRLREILGTPHADDRTPHAAQNILPSPPSSSHGHSTFSSQALKKTRLDELLDAAGVQPVPWPAKPVPQVDEVERSHQYPTRSIEASIKDNMVTSPIHHSRVSGQTDDDEVQEAARILLSMRRGH